MKKKWILVSITVAAVLAYWLLFSGISADELDTFIRGFGPWAPLAYVAAFTVLPAFFFPVAVLALACCMSTGSLGDTILQFAFMSMGLRGAVVFLPLCAALWLPGRIDRKFAMASIIIAPICVLLFGTVFNSLISFDSLFIGILASLIIMGIGLAAGRKKPQLSR